MTKLRRPAGLTRYASSDHEQGAWGFLMIPSEPMACIGCIIQLSIAETRIYYYPTENHARTTVMGSGRLEERPASLGHRLRPDAVDAGADHIGYAAPSGYCSGHLLGTVGKRDHAASSTRPGELGAVREGHRRIHQPLQLR